jgi:hypothetical protein
MSTTTRSDLVLVSEVMEDAVKGAFAGLTILNGSDAVVINDSLPQTERGGSTVKVPYFDTIGEFDDIAENDALVPQKITQTSESAVVVHSGKAIEATWWAQLAAMKASDPYVEGARQIVTGMARRVDKALIDVAQAALPAMTVDLSVLPTSTITYDAVVDARMKFGDQQNDLAMICMHSKVYGDVLKLKDGNGRPLITESITEPKGDGPGPKTGPKVSLFFGGVPLYVSDRLTAAAGVYSTLLLKKGSLVFWYNGQPRVKTGEDILADTQLAATHLYWVAYRYKRLAGSDKGGVSIIKST